MDSQWYVDGVGTSGSLLVRLFSSLRAVTLSVYKMKWQRGQRLHLFSAHAPGDIPGQGPACPPAVSDEAAGVPLSLCLSSLCRPLVSP